MTQAFGHKFTSSYGHSDNGVWYEALRGFTKLEIREGFKALLKSFSQQQSDKKEAWPPNVKEFYLYCQDAFNPYFIPSLQQAYAESQSNLTNGLNSWSHPVVFYAALYMGAETIKADFWANKIDQYKQYYLLMSLLFIDGLLPKLPPRESSRQLFATYAQGAICQPVEEGVC